MLLALLIMATITIGLLFSGWLTPAPIKADTSDPDPDPGVETTNCVTASITTNCTEATVTLSNVPPIIVCLGSSVSASTLAVVTNGVQIIDTGYTNAGNSGDDKCPDTYQTNSLTPTLLTNWWTASGCGLGTNANGPGLSTSGLNPTNGGQITVAFYQKWKHTCDTNTDIASIQGTINVEAVTCLTPSAGEWVDDGDDDPNTDTYLIQYGCNDTITITAADSLGLDASALPSCWQTSSTGNATKIDNKTYSVDGNTVGKSTINATCGTSYKAVTIIVYQAKVEIYADKGSGLGSTLPPYGHAWWNLSIQSDAMQAFIPRVYQGDEGIAAFWPKGWRLPIKNGQVRFGSEGQGNHTATSSYWWCLSLNDYIAGLTHVNNLAANPPEYIFILCNCSTEAVATCEATGGTTIASYNCGVTPATLDAILSNILPSTPVCSCSQ